MLTPLQKAVKNLWLQDMLTPSEVELIKAFITDPLADDSLDAKLQTLENAIASLLAYKDYDRAKMAVEIHTKLGKLVKEIRAVGKWEQYEARLREAGKVLIRDGFQIEVPSDI